MHVAVADRKYPDRPDPYGNVARKHGATISYHDCRTEAEVVEHCKNATVLLTYKAPISHTVFEKLDRLQVVIRIGTGFDNVNVRYATKFGVPVCNTPGYSTHDLAAHAIALMLAVSRGIPRSDRDMRTSNGWGRRENVQRMWGKTFGIVGMGRIGRATVPKAKGFDMEVIAFDPYIPDELFTLLGVKKVTFETLIETADCISVHTPLTAETRHLFSDAEFERMKESAIIVNTARGPIVEERALLHAIERNSIRGAGLDVYETEPPVDSSVFETDRIVCTPHHGGQTPEANDDCVKEVRKELDRALSGIHLENIVNPEVLQYSDELINPEST